jgi:hypothetical protein
VEHIIADEELQARLGGFLEPIEIRDQKGNVMGHYTPHVTAETRAAYERAKTLFDPAETERRIAAEHGKGIPLSEFWARLRAQEQQG